MHEEADYFLVDVLRPDRTRFAQLNAREFALPNIESFAHKRIQIDAPCDEITPWPR